MTSLELLNLFNIEDIHSLPDAVMSVLESDIERRDEIYRQLLEMNNYDLSYDWFSNIYEEELAQRKQNKQDFTPNQVARLCSLLTGLPEGKVHEPTAGNGSMLIADWNNRCRNVLPWEHLPSKNVFTCWELSNRAIPILLLNLSIRGMMGFVYHGDVLTMELKMKYVLLNRKDDTFAFSEIHKDPENKLKIIKKEKSL